MGSTSTSEFQRSQTTKSIRVSELGLPGAEEKSVLPTGGDQDLREFCRLERQERSCYALVRMGSAIIGSAATTMGCACFLLPCELHIFFKIGAVVCGVTLYALVFSLLPLPALLVVLGPTNKRASTSLLDVCYKLAKLEEVDGDASRAHKHHILNFP